MLTVKDLLQDRIVIIADDLTGANEIASVMARRGKKSVVVHDVLKIDTLQQLFHSHEGVVVNLGSRNLSGRDAYLRVKDFFAHVREATQRTIYKKIDSTVRGNVVAEIDAVLDAECTDIVVLAPALPRMGRITVGGYHLVGGVPINQSAYAENSSMPHLPTLVKEQSAYRAGCIDLQMIQRGSDAIYQNIKDEYERGSRIMVCDCCTEVDLQNLKHALLTLDLKIIPAGSAGLFAEFFKSHLLPHSSLVVCGSLNQVTRAQIKKLRATGRCRYVELDPLYATLQEEESGLQRLLIEGAKALAAEESLVVATPESMCERKGVPEMSVLRSKVSRCLAKMVRKCMENLSFSALVTTGGDTTLSILENLDADALEIVDEIEPFVPVGIIKGGMCANMTIVTKAGGFGTEDVFLKALEYITKKEEVSSPNRRKHGRSNG